MNAQVVRWPQTMPRVIVGGCDVEGFGTRYLHLGPFVLSVDHEHYVTTMSRWVLRVMVGRASCRVRL